MAAILASLAAALVLPAKAAAAVGVQQVGGSFTRPIYVTSPPGDPRVFVVERGGTIQVVNGSSTTQFLDISTLTTIDGERGLLSMAFDPNYATNGLFYVFYTGDGTDSGGTLGEGHVDEYQVSSNPDVANAGSRRQVLLISRPSSASNHNGGQLQFGPDGLLYISVGDGGTGGAPAQDVNLLNGKLLRIDPHLNGGNPYSVPATNPYVGVAGADEIWSLGLRNPWRFSFDRITGDLLIGDVGEGSREEVDWAPLSGGLGRNANYGWPSCEGNVGGGCSNPAFTAPVFAYSHTGGACAITGGFISRGNQVPELAGRYVYGDLCNHVIRSFSLSLLDDRSEGVTLSNSLWSFGEDSACTLYAVAVNGMTGAGTVSRITSTLAPGGTPACTAATFPVQGAPPSPPPVAAQPAFTTKRCTRKQRQRHKRGCRKKKRKKTISLG